MSVQQSVQNGQFLSLVASLRNAPHLFGGGFARLPDFRLSMPTLRIRSRCCARTASGHVVAAPPAA
jgi:hypothetical protein